jgi:hypothetical protein
VIVCSYESLTVGDTDLKVATVGRSGVVKPVEGWM